MKITLTAQQILDGLTEIAEANPDHKYQKPTEDGLCLYFHGDEPGCIVGQLLAKHGVTGDQMREVDDAQGWMLNERAVGDLIEAGIIDTDHEGYAMLTVAQKSQDDGNTWGEAVAEAKNVQKIFDRP